MLSSLVHSGVASPSVKGIQFALQGLHRIPPGTAELNPLRFAGMELVKELEANGFIDRIFAKKS